MFLALIVQLLQEIQVDFAGDEDVEDDTKSDEPPEVTEPYHPQNIEQSPENELHPAVRSDIPPVHQAKLLYRIDDGLKCLRVIHSEVCKHVAVETDVLLCKPAHKLGVCHAVLTCSSIDTLNPQGAEVALLGPTVAVCVGETFLVSVLCYGPDVLSGKEVTAGSLENLLAACP